MTDRQANILTYARRYLATHGAMPPLKWLSEALGIPTPTITRNLWSLQRLGYVSGLVRGTGKGRRRVWALVEGMA